MKLKNHARAGTTLVEMVVTLLIFSMMMTMAVGILSPAAKMFLRLQQLQHAQALLDNTVQELRDMVSEATGYVKIYDSVSGGTPGDPSAGVAGSPAESIAGKFGSANGQGQALEFLNPDGYVELISVQGCPATKIYVGEQHIEGNDVKEGDIPPGRLFARYYAKKEPNAGASKSFQYWYEDKAGQPVARAVGKTFADGYYMGNYLEIRFSFPAGVGAGQAVTTLTAEVKLYDGKEKTRLMAQDTVTLDLRYAAVREDGETAIREPAAAGP